MKKLSELATPQIMIYAEMVSKQFEELYNFDIDVFSCAQYGGMTAKERDDIRKDIGTKMIELEEARVKLVKEINRRIKNDMGIKFGPSDVQPFINKYIIKHPMIGKEESEIKARLKEEKDKKLKAV